MKLLWLIPLGLLCNPAAAGNLTVNKEFCDQFVIEHTPDEDVNYKPDASGDIGPPADLGGPLTIKLPKTVTVPINIDAQRYMGSLGNPANSFLDYANLGYVTMHDDGRIYFNGQPLFHEDEQAIKQACQKLREKD